MNLLSAAYDLPEPIRPRRCPGLDAMPGDHVRCECGGAGFLYPNPPDSWYDPYELTTEGGHLGRPQGDEDWRTFCEDVWRVLGVVEDTE